MDFMVFQYPMISVQACLDGILLGILFALIAGIWWWWVVGTVRNFVKLKKYAIVKFAEITKELKSIKVDLVRAKKERRKEHKKLKK